MGVPLALEELLGLNKRVGNQIGRMVFRKTIDIVVVVVIIIIIIIIVIIKYFVFLDVVFLITVVCIFLLE